MPPAVTGDTMPAASPTSSARSRATTGSTPPQGIIPARTATGGASPGDTTDSIFLRNGASRSAFASLWPRRRARPTWLTPTPSSAQPM
jgi:hypothetical protein